MEKFKLAKFFSSPSKNLVAISAQLTNMSLDQGALLSASVVVR